MALSLSLLFDLMLGFGMSFYDAQGDAAKSATLRKLQKAKASGVNVDAHMQQVADDLLGNVPLDWAQMDAEIDDEVADFLGDNNG